MSSVECLQPTDIITPKIRIQSASPIPFEETESNCSDRGVKKGNTSVRRDQPVPSSASPKTRSKTTTSLIYTNTECGDIESKMPSSRRSRSPSKSPSSQNSCSSPPPTKRAKAGAKDVDWSEVTDPEERRRIQNRIAQRKFREKAREQKERAERDSRNQEHAGNSYRIPEATDIDTEPELSGVPWGSVSLSLVLARGHEVESRRSSGKGTHKEDSHSSVQYPFSYGSSFQQTASYEGSGADDVYFDDNPYVFDPSILGQAFPSI